MLIGPARIMNKRLTSIFSLSRTPLSSMFSIPFFLGGREELLASLRTWIVSSFLGILFLGTGLHTFLRGEEALGSGRFELYHEALGIVSRGSRITILHCISIPGHCIMVIPGHCVIIIPGNCLSGRYTRWLVRMRVVYPEEMAFM